MLLRTTILSVAVPPLGLRLLLVLCLLPMLRMLLPLFVTVLLLRRMVCAMILLAPFFAIVVLLPLTRAWMSLDVG